VLTDVIMPSMSGRELVKKLLAQNAKMRVLYMSGYTDNVIAQGGVLEEGLAVSAKAVYGRGVGAESERSAGCGGRSFVRK